jgi:hypothetical protein
LATAISFEQWRYDVYGQYGYTPRSRKALHQTSWWNRRLRGQNPAKFSLALD